MESIGEKYSYDAYGTPTFKNSVGATIFTSAHGNRFLFTGREYLQAHKLYDYRNRAYSPELGRFLQPDPMGFDAGDVNLYRYCGNNPVNATDAMGLCKKSIWSKFIDQLANGIKKSMEEFTFEKALEAMWDAQPDWGDTTGKWATEQGNQAREKYKDQNAAEAVRHESWQSELTRKFGEGMAKLIGDGHEEGSKSTKDSARDLYNNQLGRENGKTSTSREESASKARSDWESGKSAKNVNDPRIRK